MGQPRYGAAVDRNHSSILRTLERIPGVTVFDASNAGEGFPDAVIGYKGANYLFEFKAGRYWRLTPAQRQFHGTWRGKVHIIESLDDALAALGIIAGA